MLELEDKLNRLQADDKQKQIADLMQTVGDLRKENERLRTVTDKIRRLTESAGTTEKAQEAPSKSKTISSPPSSESSHGLKVSLDTNTEGNLWELEDVSSPEGLAIGNAQEALEDTYSALREIEPNYDFMPFGTICNFEASISVGTPGQFYLSKATTVVPDDEKWATSNDAFVFGINTCKQVFNARNRFMKEAEQRVLYSHAAYKAILWGSTTHDERDEHERRHPLWLALRQVDERVFGDWTSKAQKIAMMFVCHRMLLYKCNPCKETLERVPMWFRPRPSQECIQHPAVIDFLIWPGLRDRLVFSHKRYTATGDFSAAFCKYLHFHWPFSDEDILLFDEGDKAWGISRLFEQYAFELRNWTMDEAFFEKYPEMKHDIPSSGRKNRNRDTEADGRRTPEAAWEGLWDFLPEIAA